jgi:hypothetical protein
MLTGRFWSILKDALSFLSDHYDHIFYVPGNHEYYKSDAINGWEEVKILTGSVSPKVHYSPDQPVVVENRRFHMDTMWFPEFSLADPFKPCISDFAQIARFEPWVYIQNESFRQNLQRNLSEGDIVITHHLPSYRSVHSRFSDSALNFFFVSEMDQIIEERKPALWLHGHTHEQVDYMLGDTRIVASPLGYPRERKPKKITKLIEV